MARRPRLDRELERYLVDGETVIVAVRLHWFHLAREILLAAGRNGLRVLGRHQGADRAPAASYVHDAQPAALVGRPRCGSLWRVLNWRHDWFVATDKRFLLFYGFIRRKVAMMPLLKVTDMTYDRSILGRILGYGNVRAGVGRPGPGAVEHRPRAGCRHPLPRDLHPALRARLDAALSAPGGPPPQPPRDDDGPDGGGGGGPADGPDAGGPAPAGARAEPRARDRGDQPSPVSRPESWYRSSNLRRPGCTSATPARSRSCGCRATTRGARSTRRRTGPTGADRTSSAGVPR